MLNDCKIQGRLTRDCELRKFESGSSFTSGTIACERNFKNREGKRDTDFIKFTASGKTAEFLNKFFHKGDMAIIEGELRPREYEQDGVKREIDEVVVRQAYFCGGKGKAEATAETQTDGDWNELPNPDDLPF